jgi:hypothetical protein
MPERNPAHLTMAFNTFIQWKPSILLLIPITITQLNKLRMDKISDFFKDLKERISNPLFSSFIVSWLVFNWKIIIGLFFYENNELKVDGYTSYLDFLSKHLMSSDIVWKPLSAALIYTFIFPFVRNCILAFNSWTRSWGNVWNLSISKTSTVSVAKYIQLREVYQKRTSLLEEVLEEEGAYLRQYEEERNKVLHLTKEKNENLSELQQWQIINDVTQLNGEWEFQYSESESPVIYRIRITNGIMEFLDTPPPNKNGQTTIRSFVRRPYSTFLTFTTFFEDENRKRSYHFFQLDIVDNMQILRGVEDDKLKIDFRRSR